VTAIADFPALPGPVRVVRLDVDSPLPELSPFREGGPSYVGAWVIVLRAGRPLGHVEVEFGGEALSAARLRELIRTGLGDVWTKPVLATVIPDARLPLVSVVVPSTFERVELLERCVASLVAQDYPSFEVVVVDNRPDGSVERAEFYRRLRADDRVDVVTQARPGSSAARNRGVEAVTGEIVAFTDDDVEVESGWLRAIGSRFASEPQTDCVTGLVLPKELETPAQIWFERSGSKIDQRYETITFANDGSSRRGFLGRLGRGRFEVTARSSGAPDETVPVYRGKFGMAANISVRTAAFRALGGFDEALGAGIPSGGGEELHLISRLVFTGRALTFDPGIAIYHTHRSDYDDLRSRMVGYGSGYTAMLFALVRGDWRHLFGLTWYALQAVGLLTRRSEQRQAGDYPEELSRAETRGLIRGPWLYLVSRRQMRRWVDESVTPLPDAVTVG
jgi:glycosyltransferase involved in cell wall biosynthesis